LEIVKEFEKSCPNVEGYRKKKRERKKERKIQRQPPRILIKSPQEFDIIHPRNLPKKNQIDLAILSDSK